MSNNLGTDVVNSIKIMGRGGVVVTVSLFTIFTLIYQSILVFISN